MPSRCIIKGVLHAAVKSARRMPKITSRKKQNTEKKRLELLKATTNQTASNTKKKTTKAATDETPHKTYQCVTCGFVSKHAPAMAIHQKACLIKHALTKVATPVLDKVSASVESNDDIKDDMQNDDLHVYVSGFETNNCIVPDTGDYMDTTEDDDSQWCVSESEEEDDSFVDLTIPPDKVGDDEWKKFLNL